MCRGCMMRRSRYTAESPNAEPASERAARSAPGSSSARADHPHALAAAAGDGLEHQRIADRRRRSASTSASDTRSSSGSSVPGTTGTPARDRRLPRGGLAAHQRDRFGRRPDEGQPGVAARGGEVLVLGEEAVAGMHRVGARLPRGVDDRVDAQVALARRVRPDRPRLVRQPHVQRRAIAVGIDRHGARCPCRGRRE